MLVKSPPKAYENSSSQAILLILVYAMDMESTQDPMKIENETNSSKRLGPCEVCGFSEAKYTCPRCEVKTCCLACVNIHKKELDCDGARNKIFYKPLSKFQNLDLLSDYRLLEDVTRSVQKIKFSPSRRFRTFLPMNLHVVKLAARDRGIRLHFLPREFRRAKENSSRLIRSTSTIHWHIEWVFPQAGVRFISKGVPETFRLAEAISPLLDPKDDINKEHRDELQYYFSAGISGICALMRVGEMENLRYHVLDLHSTIRGNLMKKSIIEFPTILIVMKDHKYSFDIYDSDEETDQWRGNWESGGASSTSPGSRSAPKSHKDPSIDNNFLFSGSGVSSDEDAE